MKPYQNQNSSKKKQVEKMFDSISFEYDKLNRLISAGNDVKWRKNIYKIKTFLLFGLAAQKLIDPLITHLEGL